MSRVHFWDASGSCCKKNVLFIFYVLHISWGGFFGSVSEYTKPPHIRDDNKDTNQYYQDLVRAPLADTQQGRVAVLAIRRFTYPAGFW
jgi:hypothetical protein